MLNLGINCLIFGGVAPFSLPVLEEGNLSKAAKQLNISQPPLSHAIKMLEEELETTLFFRGQRKITLTESGKILYSKAQHLLELQKQTTKEIQDLKKSGKGTIAFGCVSSAHMVLLEKGILPFYQKNPKITYELYEKNTYELIELLNANIIEFALIRTPFSATSYIQGNENVTFSYLKESFFASKMAIIHKKNQYLSLNAQALIATIKSHF